MLNARALFSSCAVLIVSNYNFIKCTKTRKDMYNIFHWSNDKNPFLFLGPGQDYFIKNNCKYTNCYVTNDYKYLPDRTLFDAIIFDAYNLVHEKNERNLPSGRFRSHHQKYIFTSVESEAMYPLCYSFLNNYFNYTFTHRLDSDYRRGYITIYDKKGKIVGPKANKEWRKNWDPINQEVKKKLEYKSELAAWFVSDCKSKNKRRIFVNKVQEALKKFEGQPVDIFGSCGRYDCPRGSSKCARMLQRDYYFYFAFENSFSKDYVTEKLMTALDNYNVPVVFGGADYGRFLPPGSYLNARELGPENLALKMIEISKNTSAFHDFFRWRNHYDYKDTTDTDGCKLCEIMNKARLPKKIKKDFVEWWNYDLCLK